MTVVIARVRAESSRKTRPFYRTYQIRIITHSGEQELYIEDAFSDDLAFRSGDLAYFVYKGERIVLICDVAINTYWRIKVHKGSWIPFTSLRYGYATDEP